MVEVAALAAVVSLASPAATPAAADDPAAAEMFASLIDAAAADATIAPSLDGTPSTSSAQPSVPPPPIVAMAAWEESPGAADHAMQEITSTSGRTSDEIDASLDPKEAKHDEDPRTPEPQDAFALLAMLGIGASPRQELAVQSADVPSQSDPVATPVAGGTTHPERVAAATPAPSADGMIAAESVVAALTAGGAPPVADPNAPGASPGAASTDVAAPRPAAAAGARQTIALHHPPAQDEVRRQPAHPARHAASIDAGIAREAALQARDGDDRASDLTPAFAAAPLRQATLVGPAQPTAASAEAGITRQLDMTHDGQWLDQLARDIATVGGGASQLNFRLDPVHLGSLTVRVEQGDGGATVHLQASTEQARQILVDAQPRLAAEARAQGLNLKEATVGTASTSSGGPSSQQGTADQPGYGSSNGQGSQRQQASPDRQNFMRPVAQAARRASATTERYA